MKHETILETNMSHSILGLSENDVAAFVRRCVKERSLSRLVAALNKDLMFGTQTERDDAKEALHRLGFL